MGIKDAPSGRRTAPKVPRRLNAAPRTPRRVRLASSEGGGSGSGDRERGRNERIVDTRGEKGRILLEEIETVRLWPTMLAAQGKSANPDRNPKSAPMLTKTCGRVMSDERRTLTKNGPDMPTMLPL